MMHGYAIYVYNIFNPNRGIVQFEFWKQRGVSNIYCIKYMAIVQSIIRKWKSTFNKLLLEMFWREEDEEQNQLEFLTLEVQM